MARTRPNTSSDNDAVCYTAIKTFFANDLEGKLVEFFNQILKGTLPVPTAWTRGKLCFIPKCARPARPQDLRPISLTPCLGKIFTGILVSRLSSKFPPYKAGFIGLVGCCDLPTPVGFRLGKSGSFTVSASLAFGLSSSSGFLITDFKRLC